MGIDRKKYMDAGEVRQLRTITEGQAMLGLKKGRVNTVVQWMLVDIALSCGQRVSEIAALKVEDLDLKRSCVTVIRKKRFRRKKGAKASTKQHRVVTETLMIDKGLVDHLRKYLTWRSCRIADMDKSYRHGLTDTSGPLFIGQRGPLTAQGLQQVWKVAVRRAGLPQAYSIHSARHSVAVRLLKKTGNLRQVQKQLGHTSPVTTANMYADVSDEDMQNGVTGLWDDSNGK